MILGFVSVFCSILERERDDGEEGTKEGREKEREKERLEERKKKLE